MHVDGSERLTRIRLRLAQLLDEAKMSGTTARDAALEMLRRLVAKEVFTITARRCWRGSTGFARHLICRSAARTPATPSESTIAEESSIYSREGFMTFVPAGTHTKSALRVTTRHPLASRPDVVCSCRRCAVLSVYPIRRISYISGRRVPAAATLPSGRHP